MADLDAALTTLNNTINNTISDNFPSFGYDEKSGYVENEVIHLLGRTYFLPQDEADFRKECESLFWFSYRKNFRAIGGTDFTSDRGWGCMLRCIQMLYSNTLTRHHFNRDWRWQDNTSSLYNSILRDFLDDPNGLYSIQQIAKAGCSAGKDVGTWFGPNTACQSIKILKEFNKELDLSIQIVMDNFMCIEDIKFYCKEDEKGNKKEWTPLLLMIPLRLGLNECNSVYYDTLKHCFTLPQSVGAVGGRPNSAFYFVGHHDDKLLYLDPHVTQESLSMDAIDLDMIPDETYHTQTIDLLSLANLDPSIAIAFYCSTELDFDNMCREFSQHVTAGAGSMFEMREKRPSYMTPPTSSAIEKLPENYSAEYEELKPEEGDEDEEEDSDGFEIISNS